MHRRECSTNRVRWVLVSPIVVFTSRACAAGDDDLSARAGDAPPYLSLI
ncbi:MAG: hypothetical protein MI919_15970 [Holophagales bacterium]|nr:hypothetical protein [Holophagales bacterium]